VLYLLDANILIRAHADYYAIDRVPQFWDWLLHHAGAGAIKIPLEIYDEMEEGGRPRPGDLFLPFLRRAEVKRALILREEVIPDNVTTVLTLGYGGPAPDDQALEEMGKDPFLIAYALTDVRGRCVVTAEISRRTQTGARAKIPDACQDVGVRSIGPYDFYKELNFTIDWRERLSEAAPGS